MDYSPAVASGWKYFCLRQDAMPFHQLFSWSRLPAYACMHTNFFLQDHIYGCYLIQNKLDMLESRWWPLAGRRRPTHFQDISLPSNISVAHQVAIIC
jgi:hypothetical protein